MRGAEDAGLLGEPAWSRQEVRDAEVAQSRGAVARQQHVLGFQIAMQNTEPMHARHGVGDVECDRQDAVER